MEDILRYTFREKGAHLRNKEGFYIQTEASLDNQLYDKHAIFPQHKFDTILKNETFSSLLGT
jgi:hypothetical protein